MDLQTSFSTLYDYGRPAVIIVVVVLVVHLLKTLAFPYAFPWFLNRFSARYNKLMESFKEELFKDLDSLREKPIDKDAAENGQSQPKLTILEIGVGSGANFKYYPEGSVVIGVEPKEKFAGYLAENVAKFSPGVRLDRTVVAYGEDLKGHVDDCSVDAVVCTLVLCSVKDTDAVIREAKRVLKPGGKFYFLEHVSADPSSWVYTIQWMIHPLWSYLGDGCTMTRTPWMNVDRAGFSKVHYKKFLAPIKRMRLIKPHVMGAATK